MINSLVFSPTPEVFWLKNKADLPDYYEVSLGGQELTIPNLTEEDAGPYECYGTNTQGPRAFRNFVIRVECKTKRKCSPVTWLTTHAPLIVVFKVRTIF